MLVSTESTLAAGALGMGSSLKLGIDLRRSVLSSLKRAVWVHSTVWAAASAGSSA